MEPELKTHNDGPITVYLNDACKFKKKTIHGSLKNLYICILRTMFKKKKTLSLNFFDSLIR